ncbi:MULTISPECIES: replication protein [Cytobacillus]|uniref:replication protein n=1 Tax=Cytobacillus TaxID=2675230 RepID=UPI0025A2294B|nr:replication protein [Cytobacillus kochii]MDM5208436.1 replication protein [Cytobacillus kochii]
MASPQLKRGHTRIANEILEQISMTNLNGTQLRIVMVIWRYTYGFSRKDYYFSLSFIADGIKSKRAHVDRELTSLIDRKIIKSIGFDKRRGRLLSFNKNYDEWLEKEVEQEKSPSNKTAKPSTKKKEKYEEDNTYYKMAVYFHSLVKEVAKEAQVEHLVARANLQTWADDFRKLIEIDKVDKRLAKDVMDWVTKDSFWKVNVLSSRKLREKFGELAIKMNATKKPVKPLRTVIKDSRDKEIEFSNWVAEGNDPDAFDWSK